MTQADLPASGEREPVGIAGWLVLPIIGLVLTLFRGLLGLLNLGDFAQLSGQLAPERLTAVIIEIAGNFVVMVLLPVVLLVLVAQKKRAFPRFYVGWALLAALFHVGDPILASLLFPQTSASILSELLEEDTVRVLISVGVLLLVWVPYMLLSRRVKNTFVN